jgi:hypothetical protein
VVPGAPAGAGGGGGGASGKASAASKEKYAALLAAHRGQNLDGPRFGLVVRCTLAAMAGAQAADGVMEELLAGALADVAPAGRAPLLAGLSTLLERATTSGSVRKAATGGGGDVGPRTVSALRKKLGPLGARRLLDYPIVNNVR